MNPLLDAVISRLAQLYEPLKGFAVTILLGILIQLHFRRASGGARNRQSFGPVLPFLAMTTFLVISAVKASFALSLGLVGALSIVRFRTPIKEPEELAYLFLAISVGIGAAASQITRTIVAVPTILLLSSALAQGLPAPSEHVYLSFDVPGIHDGEAAFAAVLGIVRAHATSTALLRFEVRGEILHVSAEAQLPHPEAMARIANEVRQQFPGTSIACYDESRIAVA
jgi:hypothetical protein